MPVVTDYTALLYAPLPSSFTAGYHSYWNAGQGGRSAFITYSFETTAPGYLGSFGFNATELATFRDFTNAGSSAAASASNMQFFRNALTQWGNACGVTFLEVASGQGDMQFVSIDLSRDVADGLTSPSYAYLSPSGFGSRTESVVYIDDNVMWSGVDLGYLALHEIGHALGFKHTFEGTNTLAAGLDNRDNSVLSYYGAFQYNQQLKALDLGAARAVYGTTDAAHLASWNWDAATKILTQNDGADADVMIGVNTRDVINGNGGNDTLFGFGGNDTLNGGGANDILNGGIGANAVNGGGGSDRAVYDFASAMATITHTAGGGVTITNTADGVFDTLTGIEQVVFTDRTVVVREAPRSDMTGEGASDILWFKAATAATAANSGFWSVSGATVSWTDLGSGGGYTALRTGDFDGNGTSDVLWREASTGNVGAWLMNNGAPTWRFLAGSGTTYSIVASGDFNGDNTTDLLWRDASTGHVGAWFMTNGAPTWVSISTSGQTYGVVGSGDFNGDGTTDVLWREAASGHVGAWYMLNGVPAWQSIGPSSTTYAVAGTGDFNGDGTTDVLWRDPTTGNVGAWLMNNAVATWAFIAASSPSYAIAGTGDFNGNGTTDVLWREASSGHTGMWDMNNSVPTWTYLLQASTAYNPVF